MNDPREIVSDLDTINNILKSDSIDDSERIELQEREMALTKALEKHLNGN